MGSVSERGQVLINTSYLPMAYGVLSSLRMAVIAGLLSESFDFHVDTARATADVLLDDLTTALENT